MVDVDRSRNEWNELEWQTRRRCCPRFGSKIASYLGANTIRAVEAWRRKSGVTNIYANCTLVKRKMTENRAMTRPGSWFRRDRPGVHTIHLLAGHSSFSYGRKREEESW